MIFITQVSDGVIPFKAFKMHIVIQNLIKSYNGISLCVN